jgi:hypothetical protein
MATLRTTLEQVKQQFHEFLCPTMILQVCQKHQYRFRQRVLGPVETLVAFCVQVLHGNVACHALRHWLGSDVTDAGYCQARQRLPLAIYQDVMRRVSQTVGREIQTQQWKGRRVCLVDGSTFSMPDTLELQEHFGHPSGQKDGCSFPVAELLVMVHWTTGLIVDLCTMPWRDHEQSKVGDLHPCLEAGDVLVADRGFCSYGHIARLHRRGVDLVFRLHQRQIVDFTPGRPHAVGKKERQRGLPRSRWIRTLGQTDQIVGWTKPSTCPTYLSREVWAKLPEEVTVREVRYRVETAGYRTREITLVTTLLDAQTFSSEALAELYLLRWRIELNFRDLKTTMGLEVLKCKTVQGILKELTIFALIYNLVMRLRFRVALAIGLCPARLSFVDTLRHVRVQGWTVPQRLVINPERPGRRHPRVVKRRAKPHPLMTKPRHQYLTTETDKP